MKIAPGGGWNRGVMQRCTQLAATPAPGQKCADVHKAGRSVLVRKTLIEAAAAIAIAPFSALTAPVASAAPCGSGYPGDYRLGTPTCTECLHRNPPPFATCTNPLDRPVATPSLAPGQLCADVRWPGNQC
jgi:hypothetical protein